MLRGGVLQHDTRDCGAACLGTILSRFGLKVPLIKIRNEMGAGRNGASIQEIVSTSSVYNLRGEGMKGTTDELVYGISSGEVSCPFIAHVINDEQNPHFIVVDSIKNGTVRGFDPGYGKYKVKTSEFSNIWTGYIVNFTKTELFKADNLTKGQYDRYLRIIKNEKKTLIFIIAVSLMLVSPANAMLLIISNTA